MNPHVFFSAFIYFLALWKSADLAYAFFWPFARIFAKVFLLAGLAGVAYYAALYADLDLNLSMDLEFLERAPEVVRALVWNWTQSGSESQSQSEA